MQIPKDPRAKLTEELFDRYRNARSDWDTEGLIGELIRLGIYL